VGERRKEKPPLEALTARPWVLVLDERPGLLDQEVVADTRRAARDACHAAEAAVEVLDDCRGEPERPLRGLLHQLDPSARRVHLLVPEDVRRAGRQAEATVHARLGEVLDHASTPAGSKRSRSARCTRRAAADGTPPTRCGTYAIPADGRTTASSSVESTLRRSPGTKRSRPSAAAWRVRASSHTVVLATAPPTSVRVVSSCASTAASRPSNSTATRPGWRTSTALAWRCERRSSRTTPDG